MSPLQKFVLSAPIIGPMIFKFGSKTSIPQSLNQQLSNTSDKIKIIRELSPILIKHANERGWDISQSIVSFDLSSIEKAIAGLADINKQIMVICGEGDQLTDIQQCQSWWSHWVPNSSFNVIPKSGHLVCLEQINECVEKIKNFVK